MSFFLRVESEFYLLRNNFDILLENRPFMTEKYRKILDEVVPEEVCRKACFITLS